MVDRLKYYRDIIEKFTFNIYAVFLFIIIVKFGMPACLPEAIIFPSDIFQWIIFSWPAEIFTFLSSIFLLFSCVLLISNKQRLSLPIISSLWLLLAFFSLFGFINASCFDFPYMQCLYIFGLASFSIAICNIAGYNPKAFVEFTLKAIFWTTIIIVIYGLYQFFCGLQETRDYFLQSHQMNKVLLGSNFYTRLMQNYIFSTFSLTNTYGAFLILVFPICIWYSIYRTPIIINKILPICIILLLCFSIYLTGSRTAVLALIVSILIITLYLPFSKRAKCLLIIFELVIVTSCIYALRAKGVDSIDVRIDYFNVALKLFFNNIIFGDGWGNFFFKYGFMKSFLSTEAAHSPHNFFLLFFSQAGIMSGITILIICILPILYSVRQIKYKSPDFNKPSIFILSGIIGLAIHMSLDVDFQIPSILITFIALSTVIFFLEKKSEVYSNDKRKSITWCLLMMFSIILIFISARFISSRYSLFKLYSNCTENSKFNDYARKGVKITYKELNLLFNKANLQQPLSPYPWAIMGNYYLIHNKWKKAELFFDKASVYSPLQASFYFKSAIAELHQKKFENAGKNLKKASKLFPHLYLKPYNIFLRKYKDL